MNISSLSTLKKELETLSPEDITGICLRLAKYKKENKELLHYLLFESQDEEQYRESAKAEMDEQFATLNQSQAYLAKKTLRKVLRTTNKYIKYSGNPQTEVELLLHYCTLFKQVSNTLMRQAAIQNIYTRQVQKIRQALSKLHEDLQYDYKESVSLL